MAAPEENLELRCCLCPHPADLVQSTFPALPLAQAPWCDLPCSHRVHTQCMFRRVNGQNRYSTSYNCPQCNEHMFTQEQRDWFGEQDEDNWRRNTTVDFQKLWDENETFREDIKTFKKKQEGIGEFERKANQEMSVIKREFRNAIQLPIECIAEQKRIFKKRLNALESRRKMKAWDGRLRSMQHRIEATYDLGWDDLELLKTRVKGVPRFRTWRRWRRWRSMSYYWFRVVI